MQQIGYSPNPAARALATKRTRTVGAIVPTLAHSIFARFLAAIERELAALDYGLVIATCDGDPDIETARVQDLLKLGAEAFILSGAVHSEEMIESLAGRQIPAICTSVTKTNNGLVAIGYDNGAIAADAIDHMIDLGHRHIAIIHGPSERNDRTQLRVRGAVEACKNAGIRDHYFETSLDAAGGIVAMRNLLELKPLPTAILCFSDVLALGVFFEAQRRGMTIPNDISLMGFDDLDWAAHSTPPLTTIRLPTDLMGRHVAHSIVNCLDGSKPIRSQTLAAKIIPRGSVAPIR